MNKQIRMNKDDRRKQIIDSAMKVFRERGFKGATTIEIAEAASITEVTLFRYFSSKQEIFMEGVRPILIKTLEDVVETSSGLSPKERLKAVLLNRITFISENYETIKLILNESPELSGMGESDLSSEIRKIIENTMEHAGIKPEMKKQAVRLVMGSLLSFLYMPEHDPKVIEKYVEQISSILTMQIQGDKNE